MYVDLNSFGYMPMSSIAGSCGGSIFKFLKEPGISLGTLFEDGYKQDRGG
jgi:hypothetical protein